MHPHEKKGQMKESKSLKIQIQNKMRGPSQFSIPKSEMGIRGHRYALKFGMP